MGILWSKIVELFAGKNLNITMVGLANSGKTTLLSVICTGEPSSTLPTIGSNKRQVEKDGIKLNIIDVAGQERFRELWAQESIGSDVILFVVDGNNTQDIPDAKKELHKILKDEVLSKKPICVVLNKMDLKGCISIETAKQLLGLEKFKKDIPVFDISALEKTRVDEIVDWLVETRDKLFE